MGATAIAALEHGQVDAAVLFGSAITEAQGPSLTILADSRTPDGLRAFFGVDDYPASCLIARGEWLRANPDAARRIARAVVRSLAWIRDHTAEQILAQIPAEFQVGNPAAELEAIRIAKQMYSIDGRIKPESAEAVRRVLQESGTQATFDLQQTYTNEFVR